MSCYVPMSIFWVMQLLPLRGILRCQPDILSQTYRSLHELTQFQSLVFSSGVSIVTCTETWLSPYVFDHGILSPSFTIFRKDRDGSGGGVLLAIKNFIPCSLLHSPDHLEVGSVGHLPFTGTKLIGHL